MLNIKLDENIQKVIDEYEGQVAARSRIFASFEDANYYYKDKVVKALQMFIDDAVHNSQELKAIDGYATLYRIIAAELPPEKRLDFFYSCLEPLANYQNSPESKGHLNYVLAKNSFDLQGPQTQRFIQAAIKYGNTEILEEDLFFKKQPSMVFYWLTLFIDDATQKSNAEKYENLLNNLVKDSADRAGYFFELAKLRQSKQLGYYDSYYRSCIQLGFKTVVEDPSFITIDYENDFIKWFDSLLSQGSSVAEAQKKCFGMLWSSGEKNLFSESKKHYVEALNNAHELELCSKEYAKFADDGFDWAEKWLLENKEQACHAVSDNIIGKWFASEDPCFEIPLGYLFAAGRKADLNQAGKYHACIAKFKFAEGDVVASLHSYLAMQSCEQTSGDIALRLENELRDYVQKHYSDLILKELDRQKLTTTDLPDWADDCMKSIHEFIDNGIPQKDAEYLPEYFKTNALPGILFRRESDTPLYARYLLLVKMEMMVEDAVVPTMPEFEKTLKNQKQMFHDQAATEFKDAIKAHNLLSLYDWLSTYLDPITGIDNHRKVLTILQAMVEYATPEQHAIPFLLLANFWNREEFKNPEMLQALRWLVQNDEDFTLWTEHKDADFLEKLIFKKLKLYDGKTIFF